MSRARNIPIPMGVGVSKDVTITFDDEPDLTTAYIRLRVKKHFSDTECVLLKFPDLVKSTDLATGTVVFNFDPADTIDLTARTYVYEVNIQIDDEVYVPLLGDFPLYGTFG